MKLFWTPASPFTRKVCVVARELDLWDSIEVLPTTWPHNWGYETVPFTPGLAQANPIARIPTLVTSQGHPLGDSTLACLYLNEQANERKVVPSGEAQWPMWSMYAIGDGILEAQIAMRAEHLRPELQRSTQFLSKQRDRIIRCFSQIEARIDALDAPLNLAQITIAIACSYQHWREWLDDFSGYCPNLAAWYEAFAQRPTMRATEPQETPQR
jgi:glutathione S-transferase